MVELDVIIGRWAKDNVPNLSYEECTRFNEEVLTKETTDLWKILIDTAKSDNVIF